MRDSVAFDLVMTTVKGWVADGENDAEWSGIHEGRIGLRVAQRVRDYTTMWFDIGERTIAVEAFLLPAPPADNDAALRYCLLRNRTSWPAYLALDHQGDIVVLARLPIESLDVASIETLAGAVYETVELTFPTLVALGFGKREKTS